MQFSNKIIFHIETDRSIGTGTGVCGFDTQIWQTFCPLIFCFSPLMRVRKVVSGNRKTIVSLLVLEIQEMHRCVTDRFDMTLVVKMALNSNKKHTNPLFTIFISRRKRPILVSYPYVHPYVNATSP